MISVRFPLRLPESRSPFAGAGGGQGCSTGLVLTICLLAQNVLLLPVVGAGLVSLALGPAALLVTVPLALAYGGLLWWGGLTLATDYADDHQPELLALVSPPARPDPAGGGSDAGRTPGPRAGRCSSRFSSKCSQLPISPDEHGESPLITLRGSVSEI